MSSGRWQIHLSTLIVFVVASGALLGMHVRPEIQRVHGAVETAECVHYGFPFVFYEHFESHSAGNSNYAMTEYQNPLAILANLFLILIPCVFFECWIRTQSGTAARRALLRPHLLPALLTLGLAWWIFTANWRPEVVSSGVFSSGTTSLIFSRGWPQPHFHIVSGTIQNDVIHVQAGDSPPGALKLEYNRAQGPMQKINEILLDHRNFTVPTTAIVRNFVAAVLILFSALLSSEFAWRRWLRLREAPVRNE